jgi:hypothetical protein
MHIYAVDTLVGTQFADQGITLSQSLYYDPNGAGTCVDAPTVVWIPNISLHCLGNFLPTGAILTDSYSIFFNTPQTDAALLLGTHMDGATANQTSITALLNGIVVASFEGNVHTSFFQWNNYFGFTGIAGGFNQILIQHVTPPGGDVSGFVDQQVIANVQLGAPEPGTFALFGLGTAAAALAARRKLHSYTASR